MNVRFTMTRPVPGGSQWYNIMDAQFARGDRGIIAAVSVKFPNAEAVAEGLLAELLARE